MTQSAEFSEWSTVCLIRFISQPVITLKGNGNILLSYNGAITFESINSFYKQFNNNKKYEAMLFIKGDFSKSVDYAKKLNEKSYNFIFNNCMQSSTDVLRKGTFKYFNFLWHNLLGRIRVNPIPNIAYIHVLRFWINNIIIDIATLAFSRLKLKKIKFVKGVTVL